MQQQKANVSKLLAKKLNTHKRCRTRTELFMDTLLFQQNIVLIYSCHPPHYRRKPYDTDTDAGYD